jgi:hypothetical protein
MAVEQDDTTACAPPRAQACAAAGIVFAGGNMQVAYPEVQETAAPAVHANL